MHVPFAHSAAPQQSAVSEQVSPVPAQLPPVPFVLLVAPPLATLDEALDPPAAALADVDEAELVPDTDVEAPVAAPVVEPRPPLPAAPPAPDVDASVVSLQADAVGKMQRASKPASGVFVIEGRLHDQAYRRAQPRGELVPDDG